MTATVKSKTYTETQMNTATKIAVAIAQVPEERRATLEMMISSMLIGMDIADKTRDVALA